MLLLFVSVLPAAGQGQTAVVRTNPAVLEIEPGQEVALSIILADARDAYGIDLRASFDPQLVEVVDADPARDGVQMTPGSFLKPDFVARNTADNAAGTLRYVITQVNPTEPATGAGVILTLQFRGKAPGEAALTLGPVEMADRQGQSLPVTAQSGTIRVVEDRAPAAAPTATRQAEAPPVSPGGLPCAGGALLPFVGLFGLVGWRARRHAKN